MSEDPIDVAVRRAWDRMRPKPLTPQRTAAARMIYAALAASINLETKGNGYARS